jgi:hypothetical protein
MTIAAANPKITPERLARRAVVYLRQSSPHQVKVNLESQRLQYALADHARSLGWREVEIIDSDLGWSASLGAAPRDGFDRLLAAVARGEVGIVFSRELPGCSAPTRTGAISSSCAGSSTPSSGMTTTSTTSISSMISWCWASKAR